MNAIDHVKHILERTNQERLTELFLAAAPTLRGMRRRGGWYGSCYSALGKQFYRGRGYALIVLDDVETMVPSLPDILVERIERASTELGAELERHLRGMGTPRGFADVAMSATGAGVFVGVDGIRRPVRGDYLYHLGELPHLVDDDGHLAQAYRGGLELRMRFWGNPVPNTADSR